MTATPTNHPVYPVLGGMSPPQRHALLARLPEQRLAPGEAVLRAGEPNEFVVLVRAGRLRVERRGDGVSFVRPDLGPGDSAGAMSALSGGPGAANVAAVTPAAVLLLSKADLEADESGTVALRLAREVADDLTQTNARLQLKKRHITAATNLQLRTAVMAAKLIAVLGFYVLFVALRGPWHAVWPSDALVSAFLITVCFGVAWTFVTRVSNPRHLGMSLDLAARGTRRGLWLSLPILVAALGVKAIYARQHPGHPVFEPLLGVAAAGRSDWFSWGAYLMVYIALSYTQEVVRCAIQGSIADFLRAGALPDRWRSAALSTLLFGATHVHLGIALPFLAIVAGGYWGWMYQHERNYWAVAASHAAIGVWVLFLLGAPA